MAVDMFLRIDDLKGESEDSTHKDEIQVLGWSWAATQTGTSGVGGGSGTGKVEHQDIEIKKLVDRASPVLYKLCANGQHIASADLTVRKAGGEAIEYVKIRLEDLMITSFELGGDPKNDQVLETIRINFSRAGITYTPQNTKGGSAGAKVSGGWDLKANKTFDPP
jgi:type VI secretion system secreted protein Hcp